MKKTLLILCIAFIGCNKSNPAVPNTPVDDSEISYDFNGKHYAYIGAYTDKYIGVTRVVTWVTITKSPQAGIFTVTGGKENGDIINLSFLPDSVASQLSNYKAGCNIVAENINYTAGSNDNINISIANFKNDVFNGSFSGSVTTTSRVTAHGIVTNGIIKNVKFHY